MQFRDASRRILETLQFTYHCLLQGKEESALRMLAGVTDVTKIIMSEFAQGLQLQFESETQKGFRCA